MSQPEKPQPSGSAGPDDDSSSPHAPPPARHRNDRPASNNFIWYILVFALVVLGASSYFTQKMAPKKITYSEFQEGLRSGKYTSENVHQLTISSGFITFQDAPDTPVRHTDDGKPIVPQKFAVPISSLNRLIPSLAQTLEKQKIPFTSEEPPSEWVALLSIYILPLVIFGVFLLIMFRRMGGTGAAMSFSRSRGRMHAQEDLEVTFDQVAGIDEAVEELREIVEFLRSPAKYQALGGRIPRGVLLVGPPGTGKTLLAKAVAGEAGVPFYSLSGSDFVEMFVGVGAARVRDMFAQAAARSPSIIFIDELDALGKVRGSGMPGGHDEREQTLNALLVEMDGFSSDQSVIVMAATNRPETLDPALMRPGRFDRHVLVDRPDVKGREAILKVHVGKIRIGDEVDLKQIAKLTSGFVGADLANLVNEAALLAARRNKTKVSMAEFEAGVERVVAGLEKQTKIIPPEEKQRVAYHECGHALVACSLPNTDPVHKISIIPRGLAALGYTMQRPSDDRHLITQSELENRVCVLLGGIAAEQVTFQETSTGAQNDLERATDIARRMVMEFGMSPKLGRVNYRDSQRSPFAISGYVPSNDYAHSEETTREIDLEVKRIIDQSAQTALDIVSRRQAVLEHMSRELLEKETMDAEHLQRILDEHAVVPQIKPGTHASSSISGPPPAADNHPDRLPHWKPVGEN